MARKLQADKWLFAATAGLALFGIVMVYSASAIMADRENHNQFFYVEKQLIWTGIGFLSMLFAMQVDYSRWRERRIVVPLIGLTLVLLLGVFAFRPTNGAHRWIRLSGFSLQPSELSKLAVVLFLARFLEKRAGDEQSFLRTFMPCVMFTGLFAALVVAEPDLGTALMLGLVCLVMCYTANARLLHLGLAAMPAVLGVAALSIFVPYRFARIVTFMNPWVDAQNKGFQVVQSLISVGSGGLYGLGFAQGKQKLFFLPFAHSDFIFAVIGEELGLFGALAVVSVFALFLWRGTRAALLAPDRFGMLLGIGIVASIVAQALFNISVVLSLVPTKGIPLPFISYGGSSLVPTLLAAGVLLNISQYAGASRELVPRERGESESGDGAARDPARARPVAHGLPRYPALPVSRQT